ncbi:EthD family reductase [Salipiger sp. P9]|uniref:EthD domain-containing protein n=1 Tax=Salipiger pentaromativorans TaxID=2943193 RepID=UPI002156FDA5|nr:EthD domain-containing protein [Salipiger pentaromativorans]MCR8550621.1 EthD family reductase [Salipiger pentaromativorans]
MITRFGLLTKKQGLTPEEFNAHWFRTHGPMAAKFPGLRGYWQHAVTDKEQFGISHARGQDWDLDGFSELHFDDMDAMIEAVSGEIFAPTLVDETEFLEDVKLVACEKHKVVPMEFDNGPYLKRMTLLKRLPGVSPEQFRKEWLETHADFVRRWPNVLGYHQNLVIDRYHGSRTESASYDAVPVDGIVEFWFRDKDTAAELYASDIVTETQEHAKVFLDTITPYFVETRTIV